MIHLKQIANQINTDSGTKKLPIRVHAFHGFDILVFFILEPHTNRHFVINSTKIATPKPYLKVKEYLGKSPSEFMDEEFYHNKIKYLITGLKSENLDKLFNQYGIKTHFPKNKTKREKMTILIPLSDLEAGIKKLEKTLVNFQKAYSQMVQNPTQYFSVMDMSKQSKQRNKIARLTIKKTDLDSHRAVPQNSTPKQSKGIFTQFAQNLIKHSSLNKASKNKKKSSKKNSKTQNKSKQKSNDKDKKQK